MTSANRNQNPHSAALKSTSVSQSPPDELPLPPSRRSYGAGDFIGGKYRLESLLGRGGMGEVWTARNETLAVQRAVKLIRSEADTQENTDRLLHEARAAARLADPAIVRVFDFGKTQHGDPFLVMEVLRGEDLANAIRRKERLSATRAARILLPVIRALGLAHLHGIVHRDLKPENIFLTKSADGRIQPKLLDFGIAKLKDMQSLKLTMAGSVMGSPLYMAPEQARGEEIDERVDIWALCVVLYEVISGQPPFLGETRSEVFCAATRSTPSSLVEMGLCDRPLWNLLLKGLSKKPDNRYQSMNELGKAIAGWLISQNIYDDITGSSLEASWFRESPQSFLSSTVPPGRPSLAPPAPVKMVLQGTDLAQPSSDSSPPTLSEVPKTSAVTGLVSEGLARSRTSWPTWLNTPRRKWSAIGGIAAITCLPWLFRTDVGATQDPIAAGGQLDAVNNIGSSELNNFEQNGDTGPLRQLFETAPAVIVEVTTDFPDAAIEVVVDSQASATSPTSETPSTDKHLGSAPASKPNQAARHRARIKKRRSRLLDPFQ